MDHWDNPIDLSVFSKETTADIARPSSSSTTDNGNTVINSDLIKKLITALKAKNFSNDDIKLTSNPKATGTGSQSTGSIDISAGNFDAEQKANISYLINAMIAKEITDPLTQIGILSVISKECNFIPKSEAPYDTTSNSNIRNKFNDRVNDLTKQKISDLSETELDTLKRKPEEFFNWVYGNMLGNGSVSSGDGYKYRGRGFNQLTGLYTYKKYGDRIGEDLVGNPDKVNDVDIAAKVAIEFATKGKPASSFPKFTDKIAAAEFFADVNAGGKASSHRSHAVAASNKFSIA